MPFNIDDEPKMEYETPEALLHDLRPQQIQGLLAHQADIIRDYVDTAKELSDVAFQLPTGSGKTLVGLLIGEWRRRMKNERVVFLCPTNQLVYQVSNQANNKYGIRAIPFIGPKSGYLSSDKNDYQLADAIAVTSYSSLFNIRPFFENPNLIILDDAHAAESYISDLWTLKIEKTNAEHITLFKTIVSILEPKISRSDYLRIIDNTSSNFDRNWVEKLPSPIFSEIHDEIFSAIDIGVVSTNLSYSWQNIKDHLPACHLYFSSYEILIRPILAPTFTHLPFVNAKQRLYMSATLGSSGELERISGRKNIHRLKIPQNYNKQGIGRRFFVIPERSLPEDEIDEILIKMIEKTGRGLFLCPDDRTATQIKTQIGASLDYPIFNAKEIEQSKAPFITEEKAVAILSNRYDGIDFPENECRLLIIYGLSRATNLQEKFIITRMGAVSLLNERILTRIIQAFGRCTRSATDYSAVIIRGEEITHQIMTSEWRSYLHPELQAELEFGIEQSKDLSQSQFLENLQLFLDQGNDWKKADKYINNLRSHINQLDFSGTKNLNDAVKHEVDYQIAIWNGDFISALDAARKVITELNDSELRGYRALWYYLAGCAAYDVYRLGENSLLHIAQEYFKLAQNATMTIRWLNDLSRIKALNIDNNELEIDPNLVNLIERMESIIEKLGTVHDRKFADREKEILDGINQKESKKFEHSHMLLGELLGFESGNKETDGSPDPWWIVNENLCLIFEDHSEAESDSSFHIIKARQVALHPNWVYENLPISKNGRVVTVLITPVNLVDSAAIPYLRNVCLWKLDDFRNFCEKAIKVIRDLRRTFPGSGDLAWRSEAAQKYIDNRISPNLLIKDLEGKIAADILIKKGG
jgi:hypothetical protein